jgi:hypothetical protein
LFSCKLVEKLAPEEFCKQAELICAQSGELLPGVEYSEGGDAFSLSFPTEVKPKKAKR